MPRWTLRLAFSLAGLAALAVASCHEPSYPAEGGFACDPAMGDSACPSGLTCHQDIKQCFPDDKLPPRRFKLTVTVTGMGTLAVTGGTMCSAPGCTPDFDAGAMVTLTATAALDNTLKSWGGACTGTTGNACMVTMDVAKDASVTFAPLFNVQVTKVGAGTGTVAFAPEGISCGTDCFRYAEGDTVMLTATPTAPASFAGWGDGCSGRGVCTITATATRAVRANFNSGYVPTPVKTLGSVNDDLVSSVAADSAGNIYVAGSFRQLVDFGGGNSKTPNGGSDFFVARYDRTGTLSWVKSFGGTGDDDALDLAVSGTLVWVVGTFKSPNIMLQVTHTNTTSGTADGFAMTLNTSDGVPQTSERFGGPQDDTIASIAIADDGFAFILGSYKGTPTYGTQPQPNSNVGSVDGFLMRISNTLVRSWFFRFGNALNETGVAVDNAGNDAVIVGSFEGNNVDFGCGGLNSAEALDTYVARITTNVTTTSAQCVWSRRTGSGNTGKINTPASVAVNASGVVYVASTYDDVIDGTTGLSRGGTDISIEKFNAAGSPETPLQIGGAESETAVDIAVDLQSNLMLVGNSQGTIDFMAPTGFTARSVDAFAVRLSETLVPQAAHLFGGNGDERARAVTFVPSGATAAAYLVGSFTTMGDFGGAAPVTSAGGTDGFLLEIAGQ